MRTIKLPATWPACVSPLRLWPLLATLLLLPLMACSQKVSPRAEQIAHKFGSLQVVASGFRDARGFAGISLFTNAAGFPGQRALAYRKKTAPIVAGQATVTFEQVPYGYYAVSILHDEDRNFRMNRNHSGSPTEGHGVSGNARGFWGPPSFAAARFGLFTERVTERIRVKYDASVQNQPQPKMELLRDPAASEAGPDALLPIKPPN